jgi:hypothetical protein
VLKVLKLISFINEHTAGITVEANRKNDVARSGIDKHYYS